MLVVAIDRQQHDEALRELLGQLTAAGLATLLLTSLARGTGRSWPSALSRPR